jgi:hypothetical protein
MTESFADRMRRESGQPPQPPESVNPLTSPVIESGNTEQPAMIDLSMMGMDEYAQACAIIDSGGSWWDNKRQMPITNKSQLPSPADFARGTDRERIVVQDYDAGLERLARERAALTGQDPETAVNALRAALGGGRPTPPLVNAQGAPIKSVVTPDISGVLNTSEPAKNAAAAIGQTGNAPGTGNEDKIMSWEDIMANNLSPEKAANLVKYGVTSPYEVEDYTPEELKQIPGIEDSDVEELQSLAEAMIKGEAAVREAEAQAEADKAGAGKTDAGSADAGKSDAPGDIVAPR